MIQNDQWLPACAPSAPAPAPAAPPSINNKILNKFITIIFYIHFSLFHPFCFQQFVFALELADDAIQYAVDKEVVLFA